MNDDKKKMIVAAVLSAQVRLLNQASSSAARFALCADEQERRKTKRKQDRYLRSGSLHDLSKSVWARVDNLGDDKEFLHFLGFTRESFDTILAVTEPEINAQPLHDRCSARPSQGALKRRLHSSREILAMVIKGHLSCDEIKDIHIQFVATKISYVNCVSCGSCAVVKALINDPRARVTWRIHDNEYLSECSSMTI